MVDKIYLWITEKEWRFFAFIILIIIIGFVIAAYTEVGE
jgi:hypothetical protein